MQDSEPGSTKQNVKDWMPLAIYSLENNLFHDEVPLDATVCTVLKPLTSFKIIPVMVDGNAKEESYHNLQIRRIRIYYQKFYTSLVRLP